METVNVMLSTYNGEKYVLKQINSILAQKDVDIKLYIRDDGSTDKTKEILLALDDERIKVTFANNIGWRKSFLELLWTTPMFKNEYYAFADQDDIWKPNKLTRAIKLLNESGEYPMLYHSNMTLVDAKLNIVRNKYPESFIPTTVIPQSYFDGVGTGSTMVMNGQLFSLIREYKPTAEVAHDAYIIALANFLGKVIYDNKSCILYRRHSSNATGFGKQKKIDSPSLVDRFKRYHRSPKNPYSIRAEQLLNGYQAQLKDRDILFLKKIIKSKKSFYSRVQLLFDSKFKASSLQKTLAIKYRILANTL